MMNKINVTSFSRLYALMLLSQSPKHGYELIKEVGNAFGKKVSAGEIYPFLKSLRDFNYIKVDERGEREMKKYVLTKEGKVFVANLLDRMSLVIENLMKPNLSSCAHCGCKVYGKSFEKKINNKKFAFCCKYCAQNM